MKNGLRLFQFRVPRLGQVARAIDEMDRVARTVAAEAPQGTFRSGQKRGFKTKMIARCVLAAYRHVIKGVVEGGYEELL